MKRVGHLIEKIADMENLREAFLRAAKGKSMKKEVVIYRNNLEQNLLDLHDNLLNGSYEFGHYHYFKVFDPKERTICAAAFEERVAQHAMMRILHPIFDNYQIYDSYACRVGKGTYKALDRAMAFAAKNKWFVKMDVRKFFNSIDHTTLFSQIERLIKDKALLSMIEQLVDSYETDERRGLPIGNLSSQYFANHYLSIADHYAKEHLKITSLIRYMDDILVFGNNLEEVKLQSARLGIFIQKTLRLELHPSVINRTAFGIPYLGYVVYPHHLRLNQRSRHRYLHRVKLMDKLLSDGVMSETECLNHYIAMHSFVEKANSAAFVNKVHNSKNISVGL